MKCDKKDDDKHNGFHKFEGTEYAEGFESVSRCGASVLEADFLICMIGTSNETLSLSKLCYISQRNLPAH